MNAADILAGGARLVRGQPRAVAIWGITYLLACILLLAMMWPMFADLMALQQQQIAATEAGLPPPPPPAGFFGALLTIELGLFVLFVAIFAAAVRATATVEAGLGGTDRFGFLRLGMDELRLFGLGIILVVLFFVLSFAVGLVVGFAGVAVAAVTGGGSTGGAIAVTIALMFAVTAVLVWVQVRLSLAGALTVLRGRIVLREAWRLTRGRFWTLFGVYLLIGVGYVAITLLLVAIASPELLAAYAGGMQPAAMQAALAQQQALFTNPFAPRLILTWLIGALVMAVGIAFVFGAVATAAIGFDREERG